MHELKLFYDNFEKIKLGYKKRDYRLYDDKRRLIKVGDTLKFIRLPNKDEVLFADVTNIEVFKDWYSCYSKYFEEDFSSRYKTIQDVVDDTYNGYYTQEDSDKYGCCCITISNVRLDGYKNMKQEE